MRLKSTILASFLLASAGFGAAAQDKLYPNEFPLGDVKLLEGQFKHAQDLNVDVLLKYDIDRLLAPFLKEAGLQPKGESFSCWDGLDGHVGGHYLTALAIHYAATGDQRLKDRMDYMLAELKRAQDANGNGYVGGVPNGKPLWADVKKGDVGIVWKYWVPWYNVHKIYAGLRDAWAYAGNEEAKDMFLKMCDWGIDVISAIPADKMEQMLDCEFGGMDEVYADAYQITGDQKYLDAAKKFSHHWLLDSMAKGVDNLDNKHANTQVPKVVGYQRIAELGDDGRTYQDAADFFWHTVVDTRSLSIGGNSRREHFASADDCKSYATDREGPESCNTNNMLKLTEGLWRMERDPKYVDFYERALYNHILSTQHPDHGGYVYFTSARPGHYRTYSQPNAAMWCCVGTGMENHGKYGQFIYTHAKDTLDVNLFIPSTLNWREKGVALTQTTSFPETETSRIVIDSKKAKKFVMNIRHPKWCDGFSVKVNGKEYAAGSNPGSYLAVNRKWKKGDVVEISMTMKTTVEEMPNLPNYVSILRGPIVMGAKYSTDDLTGLVADDSRWAHIAGGQLVSVFDTPILIGSREEIERKVADMQPTGNGYMQFKAPGLLSGKYADLTLEPFYRLHDCRYMMYWLSMSPKEYADYQAAEKAKEAFLLALDKRTVDAVNTGEQQPEADHFMVSEGSNKGVHNGQAWRDASGNGFFAYKMKTQGADKLILRVRYWGNENGNRAHSILIDDQLLAKENVVGKWKEDEFKELEYEIPAEMIKGKEYIQVKFQPEEGNVAGGIYHVRLARPEQSAN